MRSALDYGARTGTAILGALLAARGAGWVAIVCGGTSDLPVADEAAVTLEIFGQHVERIADVGVAGLHRLLAVRDRLEACHVLIVVAGMEGALPSAVAGLVSGRSADGSPSQAINASTTPPVRTAALSSSRRRLARPRASA